MRGLKRVLHGDQALYQRYDSQERGKAIGERKQRAQQCEQPV